MKAIRKLCASNGEYKKDGEIKKRWNRIGTMFKDDDGRVSIKIDTIPVGPDWSGWISAFPMDDRQEDSRPERASEPTTTRNVHERHGGGDAEDGEDIPF